MEHFARAEPPAGAPRYAAGDGGRLPPATALQRLFPRPPRVGTVVRRTRASIRSLLRGDDPRLLVVVGPCSIHDPETALEYADRLAPLARATSGELVVAMRTYFEKPRTCVGWKGLINDPGLDGGCDIAAGLVLARRLLAEIGERGLACAAELLDPLIAPYLVDFLSWGVIGARTVESQTHRELASGLPMPVGLKNGTDGRIDIAYDAMRAVARPHAFLGIGADGEPAVKRTSGVRDRHLVLRGGSSGPNFASDHVARAASLAADEGVARPVMVDCSHGNSGKEHARQAEVCRSVLGQVRGGPGPLLGIMLESHLNAGSQSWSPGASLARGVSITDACLDWKETERLLYEAAAAVASSRLAATG